MASNRCSICGINWPMRREYDPCPQCLTPIDRGSLNATPIDEEEAKSLKNHAEFERYYEEREERRRRERDRDFLSEQRIRP